MAVYVRAKKVTGPLNEKVKASICGHDNDRVKSYVSSGSEHDSDHRHHSSSSCSLSDLIHGFLENDDNEVRNEKINDDDDEEPTVSEKNDSDNNFISLNESIGMLRDLLKSRVRRDSGFRLLLQSQVTKAITSYSSSSSKKDVFRRRIMGYLRENGYNAGICKTKWESSGGLTGGNYEFIDVIRPPSLSSSSSSEIRYFIDIDFIGEFGIARPTSQYEKLVQILPRVYIGRSEELKKIIKLMSEAAKKSLKVNQLLLSPWRKNRFMQSKWFGPYKRTLNQASSSSSSASMASNVQLGFHQKIKFSPPPPVKCQSSSSMGFNADRDSSGSINGIINGGRLIIPVATRTR